MLSGKRKGRPLRKSIALVLALSGAGTVMLLAPVTAGAATRGVPSASSQHPVIPPAGRVQATVLPLPGQHQSQTESVQSQPFRSINPEALSTAKRTATEAMQRAPSGVGIPSFSASPLAAGLVLNQPGLSAADESWSVTPPDSTGAIGRTRYVEMVNQLVGVYDRSNLALLSRLDLGSFVGAGALTTSDPQIEWDAQANRWLYGAVGFNSTFTNNYLLFGWSKTADPSDLAGGWCRYGIGTGSNLQDYPKLGHDANFVTFGSNVFDGSQPGFPFVTANIWAIAKPAATDSTCSSLVSAIYFADATHLLRNTSDGSLASTPVPANTTDAAANGYIVAAHDPSVAAQTKVMVWHIAPGPVLVVDGDLSVGSYSVPPSVPQPGTSFRLDSLDGRLTQAVAHWDPGANAEAVWTQHTVAGGSGSMVRWYEFAPSILATPIVQQGQVASPSDFIFNAAISPSSAGSDAAIFYNRGSSTLPPVIGAQTRVSSTPLGQMDIGEVALGSSSAPDQETGFLGNCAPTCRWGDYSGATPDPVNAGVVWGSNQLSGPWFFGLAQWTTQNFAISTGTAAPAGDFSLTVSPPASQSVVAGNPASYTVTVTPSGGFTGTVTFSASGLPTGAAASFTPTSVTTSGSSTLNVTTATTTPAGTYPFTITGTSGTLTHTAPATLVVTAAPAGDFSLTVSPASQTVVAGKPASYTVNIARTGTFTGGVTFSISALPAGAGASFSPNPSITNSSALTITTTATTTPAGTYSFTVTGSTSGNLIHTASATLVVTPAPAGDFSLSATPTSRSIKQGTSTTYTVNITRTSFTGGVTFSVSGLPAGTTATFSPNPGTGASSTLTVRTTTSTPTGTYVLTITGVSISLTHTTKVTLVVTPGCFGGNGDC